jgi:hypothetical protein
MHPGVLDAFAADGLPDILGEAEDGVYETEVLRFLDALATEPDAPP